MSVYKGYKLDKVGVDYRVTHPNGKTYYLPNFDLKDAKNWVDVNKSIKPKKMGNIFSIAKQIRSEHPRMTVQASVKKAGAQIRAENKAKVSGVKKKTKARVAGAKKAGVKRKPAVNAKRIKATVHIGAIGAVARGKAIVKRIDTLEAQRKKEKNNDVKTLYAIEINAQHKKLKALQSGK
jgi:hypothetical protein